MLVTLRHQRVNLVKLVLMHVRKWSFVERITFKNICLKHKTEKSKL